MKKKVLSKIFPYILTGYRWWALVSPSALEEVLRLNRLARKGRVPAPESLNDLAKMIVLSEHEKAELRMKEMVDLLRKLFLEEDGV